MLDEELAVLQQVVPRDTVVRDRLQDAVLDVRLERLAHKLVELARQAVQVALEVALLVDDVVIFGIAHHLPLLPLVPVIRTLLHVRCTIPN